MIPDNDPQGFPAFPAFPADLRLVGHGLVLREWTEEDVPAMVGLFDDPAIAHWTPLASPFDLPAAEAYLARARQGRAAGLRLGLAITTDGTVPRGEALLIRENPGDRTASLGYTVGAAHRGQRLASRALRLMTEYAHDTADMPRVFLQIEAENHASVAVARATGFQLTDEPAVVTVSKGRTLALRTWAHDRASGPAAQGLS